MAVGVALGGTGMAMKADDKLMVILTAIVAVVAVGTMVQKGETIMAAFTSPDEYQAIEDVFAVRAGRPQILDVLSNDMNAVTEDSGRILVVSQPICGSVRRAEGGLEYYDSDACGGTLSFTYCVPQGDDCPSTTVNLSVSPPEALDGRPAVAQNNFPTLRAPSLETPTSAGQQIAPADALASLRQRPDQPLGITRPGLATGSGLAQQQSAGVSIGATASDFGMAPEIQTESAAIAVPQAPSAPVRAAVPQLGGAITPSAPSTPSLAAPALPATRTASAAPSTPGLSAPAAPQLNEQAPVVASNTVSRPVAPTLSAGRTLLGASSDGGVRRLRTLSSGSRPTAEQAVAEVRVENSTARPSVSTLDTLNGAGLVTERAAQVIVPTQGIGNASAQQPVLPTAPALETQLAALEEPSTPSLPLRIITSASALPDTEPETEVAAVTPQVPVESPAADGLPSCGVSLDLLPRTGEMIAVDILSACRPETVATVEHAGISFDVLISADGTASFEIPAFNENATVTVSFEDGATATQTVTIRGVERQARVAISWDGAINLNLNAFEFGATEGSDRHIWEENMRSYRVSRREGGGYMLRLGIEGLRQAEFYTIPASRRTSTGVVALSVRVGDGSLDCNRPVDIATVSNSYELLATNRDVTLDVGDCNGPIERLTFDRAVRDISVAQR